MTNNKLKKKIFILKRNIYYTGAVTGQQTSHNSHRPMLHRHNKNPTASMKNPYTQLKGIIFITHTTL
jgi:hypothetical protein